MYGQKYKPLLKQLDLNINNKVNSLHRTVLQECGPLNTCIRNSGNLLKLQISEPYASSIKSSSVEVGPGIGHF